MWKEINKIQNKSLNKINCKIKYFNLLELKEIKNNLENISIIQSKNIKTLSYRNIEYDILYYGNSKILASLSSLNNLKITNLDNSCIIKLN